MKAINIFAVLISFIIFPSLIFSQSIIQDTTNTPLTQYRRGIGLLKIPSLEGQKGYQTYEKKYEGKNLLEEKQRLYPLGFPDNVGTSGTNHLNKVTTGTGTWTELNPKVPRVDYLGIHFINPDTGWAVGNLGAIIKTTDGGNNWITEESGVSVVLKTIGSFSGRVVIAAGDAGTVLTSTDLGKSWQQINIGTTNNLWNLKFITEQIGWLVGEGGCCFKTTDGGFNWQNITTPLGTLPCWDVSFINEQLGYICSSDGKVIKTTDGGNSWQVLQAGDSNSLYTIVAVDSMNITAGGALVKFVYSSDGGITWTQQLLSQDAPANKMAFINDSVGYATGLMSSKYKTTNKGKDWIAEFPTPPLGEWNLMFVNATTGYTVGNGLKVLKTTDSGKSWFKTILNDNFKDVWFASENTGWIVGDGIYKTTNGGENWTLLNFPYEQTGTGYGGIESLYFLDSLTGFAGTWGSKIFKTYDGGETWVRKDPVNSDSSFFIKDFYFIRNMGWASSIFGKILKTTDYGDSWIILTAKIGGNAIQFLDTLNGYSLTGYFNRTSDGGYSWEQFSLPQNDNNHDLYFKNIEEGWFVGSDYLYYTTNAGKDWKVISNVNNLDPWSYFGWLNLQRGIITGNHVYESINGGESWFEIKELTGQHINRFFAPNEFIGYAVGDKGLILEFTDTAYVPVELIFFKSKIENNNIILTWQTASELNNKGFYIEKSSDKKTWFNIGYVVGKGTTTEFNSYSYADEKTESGIQYYKLKQVDYNGNYEYSNILKVSLTTSIRGELLQNYPNPFNSSTIINYSIPNKSLVTLRIFNSLGQNIKTLINETKEEGEYKIKFDARDLPSGVYFYRINAGEFSQIKKMIIIK